VQRPLADGNACWDLAVATRRGDEGSPIVHAFVSIAAAAEQHRATTNAGDGGGAAPVPGDTLDADRA